MSLETCPVCGGQKTVSKPLWIAGDVHMWMASDNVLYPCPICGGKGYIEVNINE